MLNFKFGDIVFVTDVLDLQGRNAKDRPAVFIGSRVVDEVVVAVRVMAITTAVPDPAPSGFILLPWSQPRHPRTGLNKRCAAVVLWSPWVAPEQVQHFIGCVPGRQQAEILAMLPPDE